MSFSLEEPVSGSVIELSWQAINNAARSRTSEKNNAFIFCSFFVINILLKEPLQINKKGLGGTYQVCFKLLKLCCRFLAEGQFLL